MLYYSNIHPPIWAINLIMRKIRRSYIMERTEPSEKDHSLMTISGKRSKYQILIVFTTNIYLSLSLMQLLVIFFKSNHHVHMSLNKIQFICEILQKCHFRHRVSWWRKLWEAWTYLVSKKTVFIKKLLYLHLK